MVLRWDRLVACLCFNTTSSSSEDGGLRSFWATFPCQEAASMGSRSASMGWREGGGQVGKPGGSGQQAYNLAGAPGGSLQQGRKLCKQAGCIHMHHMAMSHHHLVISCCGYVGGQHMYKLAGTPWRHTIMGAAGVPGNIWVCKSVHNQGAANTVRTLSP